MRRRTLLLASVWLCVAACGPRAEAPKDVLLLRVAGPWSRLTADADDRRRTAAATILILRGTGEYVEFHGTLIEQPDETLYISADHPYIAISGRWEQDGDEVEVRRNRVYRRVVNPRAEPYCVNRELEFRIEAGTLAGEAGEGSPGTYAPVTRLVAPDFPSYIDRANEDGVRCEGN